MPQRRAILLALPAMMLSPALPGCAWMRNFGGGRPAAPVCVLSPDASKEEVIAYLNANTSKLMAWRTDRAMISVRGKVGIPIRVPASIAVESPRNFRLIAHGPVMGGKEADFGSNAEHFWFWNKQNEEKYVFRARHEEDPNRMRRFPIPFQPDWIMESLGVIEIDPDQVTMQPGEPGKQNVTLWADRISAQGFKVRKATVVDTCQGVVREHVLYDARGQLIARAVLSGHVPDARSLVVLPTRIDLDWPQAQLGITMTLSEIEVNPPHFPAQTWRVPDYPGYKIWDLGRDGSP